MTTADPPRDAPAVAERRLFRRIDDRFELLVDSVQDYAIFMLDVEGRVMTWNAGAQKIKGWTADEIIGRSFESFYPADAVASGWPKQELRYASAEGRFENHGWRVRKDGSLLWASVVITALRGEHGQLVGFAKVTRDLTEVKRQEEALRQSEEQLRLLVESVKDYAIFMLDPQGRILTWNAGAAAIHGYSASEVLLQHFSRFFTPEDKEAGRPARELARALSEGRAEEQGWRVRKDSSVFWAGVVITPVLDAEGVLRGFAKVTRDLTEQRRLVELEHGSRRMSEFLAMLAHELRNPLAPIRNAVNILQMQRDLSPALVQTRDIIGRQVGQLTRLVDDLLDVGRIVTGKILLKSERMDYRDVVQASVEATAPLLEARGHRLTVTLPDEPIPMNGDPTRLAQALQNLLSNAARYTPDGGEVQVTVRVEAAVVITAVRDNGIGISPRALEQIFELFAQEPSARAPSEGGLGIGLSLARTLVEQHGGMLTAHSDGRGLGSTFTLRLPLRRDWAQGAAPRAPLPVPELGEARRRVLVVDDNRDSADTMVQLLMLLGHEALGAYGASEALSMAGLLRPHIVLLDLNMPDGDGYSVLGQLRSHPSLQGAPLFVAAMTGYGQKSDQENTLQAGFDAHLTKPVDVGRLRDVLQQAIAPQGGDSSRS
jgi:PAS domain S-box-containing protein